MVFFFEKNQIIDFQYFVAPPLYIINYAVPKNRGENAGNNNILLLNIYTGSVKKLYEFCSRMEYGHTKSTHGTSSSETHAALWSDLIAHLYPAIVAVRRSSVALA